MSRMNARKADEERAAQAPTATPQAAQAAPAPQVEPKKLDETVPGGRYLLPDGKTLVDADGKRIEEKEEK
jgi:hypothetical protein